MASHELEHPTASEANDLSTFIEDDGAYEEPDSDWEADSADEADSGEESDSDHDVPEPIAVTKRPRVCTQGQQPYGE